MGICESNGNNASEKNEGKLNDNYIIGEIFIDEYNLNTEIPIICSYEAINRQNHYLEKSLCNEEEIIKCEIEIDNIKIPFSYSHKFNTIGKHIIKYSFKRYLTNMSYMFYGCSSLISLNFSCFKTENVASMNNIFSYCQSLTDVNLSNFNSKILINIKNLFHMPVSNLNLSNFNAEKVTDMSKMFKDCPSLSNLNLSNFNTKNVTNMSEMFYGCSSLSSLNLSNFNTKNVTNMNKMFCGCSSLLNLNLSNFSTHNVIEMSAMFADC